MTKPAIQCSVERAPRRSKKRSITSWGTLAGPWTPVSEGIRLSGYVGSIWFPGTVRIVNIEMKKKRRT
jgi:hypothetical protein